MVDMAKNRDNSNISVLENRKVKEKARNKTSYIIIKRVFDVIFSGTALIILSPLFLLIALLIKVEDKGTIIYKQIRIGKDCKPFQMYKFRSMKIDADKIHEKLKLEYQNTEVSFKLKKDPRVTRIGYIIRKFNLDELPQLWNVLRGDMSLVGPRPLPDYEYKMEQELYGKKYIERYRVPQGLTCIWQISNRAEVEFENRMQMDVDYAKERSFMLDLSLIVKTFLYTIIGKASY